MGDKKVTAEGWPKVTGDYILGDPESPVAVATLGSDLGDAPIKAGAAISGPLHTENLGIEKVVANLVANPNIRFLIVCGSEVQGHITGQTVNSIYKNGIDPERKNIIGSIGAIPYVENLPVEGVERFRNQVQVIDLVDVEDHETIHSKIKECLISDAGAYEEETTIIPIPKQKDSELATENT